MKLIDYLLVIIIACIMIYCIKKSNSHFQGEGGCCNLNGIIEDQKQLDQPIVLKRKMKIKGMSCKQCAIRIQNKLNEIREIKAEVNYKRNVAIIYDTKGIEDAILIDCIERLGYHVGKIDVM